MADSLSPTQPAFKAPFFKLNKLPRHSTPLNDINNTNRKNIPIRNFHSTGFLRKSASSRSELAPSTPSKPSLPYYAQTTNTSKLHFLYPQSSSSLAAAVSPPSSSYFDSNFVVVKNLGGGQFADTFHTISANYPDSHFCIKKTKHEFTGTKDRYFLP